MFGLQIRGSVSRSNSVIRTASGCSSTISYNHLFRIKNYPNEHRISRSQNRFSSGLRSLSPPTDLPNFIALKKTTATTDHTRFASRTTKNREEEDYEENEEVEEEQSKIEVVETAHEEEEVEETRPKYAVSFLPYFQKEIPDQFRENEDFAMDDLNQEAHNKYARAVEERDAAETIRYRVEVAKTTEEDDKVVDPACMVRDLYKEEQLKAEERVFSHIQPCNMRPFGASDSLFFPHRNNKAKYPVYRKFGENDPQGGSSQQRDYSTTSRRTRCDEVKVYKSESKKSAKEQRPQSRKSSGLRKMAKPTLQVRLQTLEAKTPTLKPLKEEKLVVNKALNFAKKYNEIYLGSKKLSTEKPKPAKVQCSVNILAPKKSKGVVRPTQRINLLQSSLSPEEAALAEVKPTKNKRMIPPWPSYSETLQHRTAPPISTITFPNPIHIKSKTESLQAREFSTGLQHQKRRLGNKKHTQWTFRLPRRGYSWLYDRPDCPKPRKARMKDCRPLKPPKKKKIKQERKCVVEVAEICPVRTDSGLKVKRKKLPKIVPGPCKRQKSKLKDCAPVKRLKKVRIPEPAKCEVKKSRICVERADDNLRVKKKKLPLLEPEECAKPKPKPMKDVKLARLKKVKIQPPPRLCVKKIKFCPPRADAFLKSKRKKLPILEHEECSKPPPAPRKDAPPLQRLKKVAIAEPPKICEKPKKFCPERADKGLKVSAKCLPVLEPHECPKPPPKPMKDCRSLQRLPKVEFDEPPKCKVVRKKVCLEAARADANLTVKSKRLPELVAHDGCKPKSRKMKDCKPIKRLKKVTIAQPRVCVRKAVECDVKQADSKLISKRKRLPKLQASDCPKVPSKPMKDVKLARLAKVKMEEPPKICPKPKAECLERADDGWTLKKKRLPELEESDCPQVPAKPMKNVKLLRLKKVEMEEPKKVCPKKEECPERADVIAGYKIKKKPLRTVILNKKYNDISFRHFKKGKKKTKAPYFNTKRDYCFITRSYSNGVYYHPKNRLKQAVYRAKSISSKQCAPKKPLCPPPTPPCAPPPKKSFWQRICDYFRARPGCPPPDEWKKKRLREKAEKAAKAAGLYLCECPRAQRKVVCFRKKPPRRHEPKNERCPKFKMPYCNESVQRSCEEKVTAIECDPPRETPYPSFSEWKREMTARKISECKVADKKAQEMKGKIKVLNKRNKNKKKGARCFSTSTFYTQERANRIINELDRELQKTTDVNNAMVKKLLPVL